jgi:hypothetical protein
MSGRTTAVCLLLTLLAPAAGHGQETGPRLVLVTFERRVSPYFRDHPGEYGSFLSSRRREVLDLLFRAEQPLLRPGDAVALFADGAHETFPGSLRLSADAGPQAVMEALRPLLQPPGLEPRSPGVLWLGVRRSPGFSTELDQALRSRVTCALAGLPASCASESPSRWPWGTRGYSRPLLTLPLQLKLALEAVKARSLPRPTEVLWVWVQGGERVNEINSLVAEIDRDFPDDLTAQAVRRYWFSSIEALEIQPEPLEGLEEPAAGGGTTLWNIASSGLRPFIKSDHIPPLKLQQRQEGRWRDLSSRQVRPSSLYKQAEPLLDPGEIRAVLSRSSGPSARILSLSGRAWCEAGDRQEELPLRFQIAADQASALLMDKSRRALGRLASRCSEPQGLLSRVRREIGQGRHGAGLRLAAYGAVGPAPRPDGIDSPSILGSVILHRTWRHDALGLGGWLFLGFVFLLLLGTIVGIWRLWLFLKSPAQVGFELVDRSGKPVTAETVVSLAPGEKGKESLSLRLVHLRGPERRGQFEIQVRGRGLQSQIPLRHPGQADDQVVVVRSEPLPLRRRGKPGRSGRALKVAELDLYAPDNVLDVDAMPVGQPRRAGVEISCSARSSPGIQVVKRVFYVPCQITVGRAAPQRPELSLQIRQGYRYRGLRPAPGGEPELLGTLRVRHRAEPGTAARPHPVRLDLRFRAARTSLDDGQVQRIQAAFGDPRSGLPRGERCVVEVDSPSLELSLFVWPGVESSSREAAGDVHVSVDGSWSVVRQDAAPQVQPLEPCREICPWYPTGRLEGIAVDFGTSATRVAWLGEDHPYQNVMQIAVPKDLVRDPELTGELESEVAVSPSGRLVAAGALAHLELEPNEVIPSLKAALMNDSANGRIWSSAEQVIALLGQRIEGPRRQPDLPLELCYWLRGKWEKFPGPFIDEGFRYLLLLTLPDTFGAPEQEKLIGCFRTWEGKVRILPLREAEAVVYGVLVREPSRRPERTLVVDVGAGTVDFAAVRSFYKAGELEVLQVQGLAVSRAAGNEYDEILAGFFGRSGDDLRRKREFKQRFFLDPEAGGKAVNEENELQRQHFLSSRELRAHFDQAIAEPLEGLAARLAHQPDWTELRFDQVCLTGRGSLALGWKRNLVRELKERDLVRAEEEDVWLRWLDSGTLEDRADRLKAAVVNGALALIGHHQIRIQTSHEILRDHLILLVQVEAMRYEFRPLAEAGRTIGPNGLRLEAELGDAIAAKVALVSHLPGLAASKAVRLQVSARDLWERAARPGNGGAPAVTAAAEIPLRSRRGAADRIEVWVHRNGRLECSWKKRA